jgi:Flp pilus assembly protein TadG
MNKFAVPLLPRRVVAWCARCDAGTAALEFAIIAPVLMALTAAMVDVGGLLHSRMLVANAVSAAGHYAFMAGPTVTPATLGAIVTSTAGMSGVTPTVTGPACYCPTGSPLALSAVTCGTTCAGGVAVGTYVTIRASFPATTLLRGYSFTSQANLAEQVIVRLQ